MLKEISTDLASEDLDWISIYKKPTIILDQPRLWLPCGNVLSKSLHVVAHDVTLQTFMSLTLHPVSSAQIEHWLCPEFQNSNNILSGALFDLFLLEIGCKLPKLSGVSEIELDGKDLSQLRFCMNVLAKSSNGVHLSKSESKSKKEIYRRSNSSVGVVVFDFIRELDTIRNKDDTKYKEMI